MSLPAESSPPLPEAPLIEEAGPGFSEPEARSPEGDDEAGGPPWLPAIANWLLGAGMLLLLPRQWFPAGACLVVGVALRRWLDTRARDARV
jgi:hypothetical protein